jgi:hypothetical protein
MAPPVDSALTSRDESLLSRRYAQVPTVAAAAINLERVSDRLAGVGRERTRRSAFARVMQPLVAELLIG